MTEPRSDAWSWLPPAGGEACEIVRALDWAATPLGPVAGWSRALRTTAATLLLSRHPMFLWWGPELVQFYNDAYRPSFGVGRHPAAMGQRGRDCWPEIWPIIGPQIEGVMQRGESTWQVDALVPIERNGRIEEVYWTYGYSPVIDDDGSIGGTLVVCTETTSNVVLTRRLRTMRALSDALASAFEIDDMLRAAGHVIAGEPRAVPWSVLYRIDVARGAPRVVDERGAEPATVSAVTQLVRDRLERSGAALEPFEIDLSRAGVALPATPWPEPSTVALALPIAASAERAPFALAVLGLSPRLPYDDVYRAHLESLATQIGRAEPRIETLRAQEEIQRARDQLVQQAPFAAALLFGPEHVFQLANPSYEEMVDRRVVGKSYREAFPELEGTALPAILDEVYRGGERYVAKEARLPLRRGAKGELQEGYFDFTLEPLRDGYGDVIGMMAVAIEITESVRARQALERAGLERDKLLLELETASRAKDEFLAMLGHELRNPLSPIVTALQLIRMRGELASTRELAVIERQIAHLTRLVDDLLEVSKITRGKIELRIDVAHVAEVLSKAVEMASALFEQRRHELHIDVPAGMHWRGDAVRLAQVVANLLTNAARYTEPGGHVRLSAERGGDELIVRVQDDGRGIAPELLPRLFEPFTQGHRSFDRHEGGLGIGLALVRSLVTLHRGSVEARSDGPGTGSEFVVRLPGVVDERSIAAPSPSTIEPAGLGRRVLVVDDNTDAADMLAEFLRAAGHQVEVFYDPVTALAHAREADHDVALLDIGLPVIDGYELAEQLLAARAECLLVAITGYGQDVDAERSRTAGFAHHLVKPVDPAHVLSLIDASSPS
ncbi:MAG: ATP-binding protein [Myxococcota bacterium]|nr:ATP-binding protein [Myxococcota bacterium]